MEERGVNASSAPRPAFLPLTEPWYEYYEHCTRHEVLAPGLSGHGSEAPTALMPRSGQTGQPAGSRVQHVRSDGGTERGPLPWSREKRRQGEGGEWGELRRCGKKVLGVNKVSSREQENRGGKRKGKQDRKGGHGSEVPLKGTLPSQGSEHPRLSSHGHWAST